MKKYTNQGFVQAIVEFNDGTAQFLIRGQSIQTSKAVKKIRGDVKVTDVAKKNTKRDTKASED